MPRIKVTGYLNTEDLDPSQVDTSHEMGLSNKGYEEMSSELGLEDLEFTLQAGED
jgi:hypothetical protein